MSAYGLYKRLRPRQGLIRRAEERWVLAFDASCEKCRKISSVIARACAGQLEVLPLAHGDVRRWCEQAARTQAPWAPTLIRIRGADVRTWTGPALSIAIVRCLGVRSTVRVIGALNDLQQQKKEYFTSDRAAGRDFTRMQFFRFASGAMATAGLILMGKTPAWGMEERAVMGSGVQTKKSQTAEPYKKGELSSQPDIPPPVCEPRDQHDDGYTWEYDKTTCFKPYGKPESCTYHFWVYNTGCTDWWCTARKVHCTKQ